MSTPGFGDNPYNGGENEGEQPDQQPNPASTPTPDSQHDVNQYSAQNPYPAAQGQPYGGAPYDPNRYGQYQQNPGTQQFSGLNTGEAKKTGKGFFGALFDTSFDNMIALKFARFIYTLALILAAATLFFGWIVPVFMLLFSWGSGSTAMAFAVLLFGWIPVGLLALFQLIGIRLFLEFVVSTIKTAENTSKLVAQR